MVRKASIPSHCLHKATGQGYVRIAGRFHYTGVYGTAAAESEYNRIVADWFALGRPKVFAPAGKHNPNRYSVVELIANYWRFANSHYRKDGEPTGEVPGIKAAMSVLKVIAVDMAADEVGPKDLKRVQQHCIAKGNSRKYINKLVGRIKRAFKWAASEQLIDGATFRDLLTVQPLLEGRTSAKETPPVLPVADSDVNATLVELREEIAAMVKLQRLTGMRPMEVCELRPCHIDSSGEVWIYRLPTHKMSHKGRERVIAIGPKGQMILRCRMDREFCFLTNRGNPYSTRRYRDAIHRACKRAGIAKWNPNQLRHAAATEIRKEFDLNAARTVLGHSKTTTTEIYAEKDLEQAMEVARRIG